MISPAIQDAITRAATEEGVDPAFALATAERESNFDPNAHASRSIYGLFQMSGDLRGRYGAGDSTDPYTQAKAWSRFIGDTKAGLAQRIGRDPTNDELYLAHYLGEGRAARLIGGQVAPSTSVADVFTPTERRLNPNFDRAGTVGNLMSGISADMEKRQAKYGGAHQSMPASIDFGQYGQPNASQGAPNLLDQAREQYPALKNYDIKYKENFGGGSGYLESWPPGETGTDKTPRPQEFGNKDFGVEVYDPKTTPKDVLGDVVSHHLINVDPTIKGIYDKFSQSLQPFQEDILKDQYKYAQQNEGETRPYADWRQQSGLPGYFRGYTFNQWPDDFNQKAYTPDQMQQLDGVMKYMQSQPQGSPATPGRPSQEPAGVDFASFGHPQDGAAVSPNSTESGLTYKSTSPEAIDFAQFGTAQNEENNSQAIPTAQGLGTARLEN